MRMRPSGRDEKLSRKKKIIKRSEGNIGKQRKGVCRRREQKELKVPQIQNSFSVVEQMFERRASGSRRAFLAESFFFFFPGC